MLRSYAKCVTFYVNNNPKYSHWKDNWKILDKNLDKTDLLVERLSDDDEDVAYTENKGEVIRFRWRDGKSYMQRQVFVYVLLHELTHQCFPRSFTGHKSPFPEMLCILCVAGYELQLFDLSKVPINVVYTNGQPLTSKGGLRNEIINGIKMLEQVNPDSKTYYQHLKQSVESK